MVLFPAIAKQFSTSTPSMMLNKEKHNRKILYFFFLELQISKYMVKLTTILKTIKHIFLILFLKIFRDSLTILGTILESKLILYLILI